MPITNRYFILPHPNQNSKLWDITVGKENITRKNIAVNKIVVKLKVGDNKQHALLNGMPEYTHAQILVEMKKATWSKNTRE